MIRRPPRSTLDRSSAASDVYKRQIIANLEVLNFLFSLEGWFGITNLHKIPDYGSAEIAPLQLTIKENHFRFLLGYKF